MEVTYCLRASKVAETAYGANIPTEINVADNIIISTRCIFFSGTKLELTCQATACGSDLVEKPNPELMEK